MFFGMVRQCQKKGKCPSKAVSKAAKGVKPKAAKEFAQTKHKGIPKKKHHFDEQKFTSFEKWLQKKDESLWLPGNVKPYDPSTGLGSQAGIGTAKAGDLTDPYLPHRKRKPKIEVIKIIKWNPNFKEWLEV